MISRLAPENFAWLAQYFLGQLVGWGLAPPEETDSEVMALVAPAGDKGRATLQKLHRRISTPSFGEVSGFNRRGRLRPVANPAACVFWALFVDFARFCCASLDLTHVKLTASVENENVGSAPSQYSKTCLLAAVDQPLICVHNAVAMLDGRPSASFRVTGFGIVSSC